MFECLQPLVCLRNFSDHGQACHLRDAAATAVQRQEGSGEQRIDGKDSPKLAYGGGPTQIHDRG